MQGSQRAAAMLLGSELVSCHLAKNVLNCCLISLPEDNRILHTMISFGRKNKTIFFYVLLNQQVFHSVSEF